MLKSRCLFGLLALLSLSVPAPPLRSQEAPAQDPTVHEVVRLLESGVSEPVILRWLDTADPPREVTADDLIRLREVGASDHLTASLLDRLIAETETPATEPGATEPGATQPTTQPSPAEPPAAAPSPAAPEPSSGPLADAGVDVTEVRFEIRYRSLYDPEGNQGELYLYLDGRPLAWKQPSGRVGEKRLIFTQLLPAGAHVLRLGLETHRRASGRYHHGARIHPKALDLQVSPGPEMAVDLDLLEDGFSFREAGPLTYRVTQGVATYVFLDKEGPAFDDWPYLCDDVEDGQGEGKKLPRSARRKLEGCLRWADLWSGVAGAPTRAETLEEMARFDFRPVPRNSRIYR